jgi:hypothetical protein
MVGTRSLSSGAHSRDPLALPTYVCYGTDLPVVSRSSAKNISLRRKVEAVLLGCPSCLGKRGVAHVINVECGMRWMRRARLTRARSVYGEVVAS